MCVRGNLLKLSLIFLLPGPESDEQDVALLEELNNDESEDY